MNTELSLLDFLNPEDEDWPYITHVDCRRPVPSEARFKSQIIPYGICSVKLDAGTSFSRVLQFYAAFKIEGTKLLRIFGSYGNSVVF
jgi:hypothetical protein